MPNAKTAAKVKRHFFTFFNFVGFKLNDIDSDSLKNDNHIERP